MGAGRFALFYLICIRQGWTTLAFAPPMGEEVFWNGVHSPANAFCLLRSGVDHDVRVSAGFASIEIDIADRLLRSEGLLPETLFASALGPEKGMLRLAKKEAAAARWHLSTLLDRYIRPAQTHLTKDSSLTLRRQILDLVAVATQSTFRDERGRTVLRGRRAYPLLRRARDLLDSQLASTLQIESIARELNVSTRVLQRSFLATLGVSPKQYFLARRLDAARRAMLSRHATSISQIANDFGFVSASRFAEQYRRQFGHAPSTVFWSTTS